MELAAQTGCKTMTDTYWPCWKALRQTTVTRSELSPVVRGGYLVRLLGGHLVDGLYFGTREGVGSRIR